MCGRVHEYLFHNFSSYLLGLTEEREKYSSHQLKSSEYDHIKKYRTLDLYGQETVSYILDREADRVASLQKKDAHIKELETRPAADVRYLDALRIYIIKDYLSSTG